MPPPRKGRAEKLGPKKDNKKDDTKGGDKKGLTSNVSPVQSMAMTGDTSLAGLSQEAASSALKAGQRNKQGTKHTGNLADFMAKKNAQIAQNQARVERNLLADPSMAGFKGFLPQGVGQGIQNFGQGIGQGIQKFGQGIMQNITPGRMIASTIGSALLGPVGGILAGLLANRATTDAFKTDVRDTINFFRPNFNVDTPDADIVRAGDFNVMDRITGAIAAPNISTGLQTLFAPRGLGLPEDFLDQSAVQTQQLVPLMGMQYDDFIN